MTIMTEQEAKSFLHGMFSAFNNADWDLLSLLSHSLSQ